MKKILYLLTALLGFVACEELLDESLVPTLKLTVDNSKIEANGSDVVTFSITDSNDVEITDATIYFADTNEALSEVAFSIAPPIPIEVVVWLISAILCLGSLVMMLMVPPMADEP